MILIPLEPDGKKATPRGWASLGFETPDPFPADANIGLRTDGLVIVDADNERAVRWWTQRAPMAGVMVRTPKGVHFYYRMPDGARIKPSVNRELGLDVRAGSGSYVVMPGSVVNGTAYRWIKGIAFTGDLSVLSPAPLDLIAEIQPQRDEAPVEGPGWDVIPEGRRNATLTALAGSLRRQGASGEIIARTLTGLNQAVCVPPLEPAEIVTIVRSVLRYEPDPDEEDGDIEIIQDDDGLNLEDDEERPLILSAKAMELQPPPKWWHHPYIPAGRLVLMDGNEGIGKGMFATWAAVSMASGAWGEPGRVLWGSTEDDPEEDILRRLMAAGYDKERHDDIFFLNGEAMFWRFPAEIRPLAEMVRDHGIKLMILDPGRSFLGPPPGMSAGEFSYNSEAHLRPGLERLNLLARRLDVTILFIHHWNKNLTASIRVRSGGSAAFAQTVRHRITLDYASGEHALAVEKSNMTSRENTVMGYELVPDDHWQTARFVWGEALPYVDLDAWEEAVKGKEKALDKGQELQVAVDMVVEVAEGELEPGGKFWSRQDLMDRWGYSQRFAQQVLTSLTDSGFVTRAQGNVLLWRRGELDA